MISGKNGFTTVEMLVTVAIFGVLSSVLAWILISGTRQRHAGMERLSDIHEASYLMKMISNDIECATMIKPVTDNRHIELYSEGQTVVYKANPGLSAGRFHVTRTENGADQKGFGFAAGEGRFTKVSFSAGPDVNNIEWVDLNILVMNDFIDGQPLDFSRRIWSKSNKNNSGMWVGIP